MKPNSKEPIKNKLPESYQIGQELNWDSETIPIVMCVELPFWLMTSNGSIVIAIDDCEFMVEIVDDYLELFVAQMLESRSTCVHIGTERSKINPEIVEHVQRHKLPYLTRKCKSVLKIHSKCNRDALDASQEGGQRANAAHFFLQAYCEAHLEIINRVVQEYRLLTYDYFPFEVNPWDVPTWFLDNGDSTVKVNLLEYASWDLKPVIKAADGNLDKYELISFADFQSKKGVQPNPGELELLDAMNFMERGNYSDAVRRITTAIESIAETALRDELLKHYSEEEVESQLDESKNDFPGRLRQYLKLSGRRISPQLESELNNIRTLRHKIVHRGYRINLNERGTAQRCVDTGRWIYNWLENKPDRVSLREKRIATRSLGRHHSLFDAKITAEGVVVHQPTDLNRMRS